MYSDSVICVTQNDSVYCTVFSPQGSYTTPPGLFPFITLKNRCQRREGGPVMSKCVFKKKLMLLWTTVMLPDEISEAIGALDQI